MVEFDRFNTSDKNTTSRLKVTVVGVGGGGLNVLDRISLDRMMEAKLVSMDTDIRDLNHSMAPSKIQLGSELILGIGSGGDPDLAAQAAELTADEIRGSLYGSDIVFICGGLGGGTCSGAAPVIAQIAKRLGAMVFVFASMPFAFQGRRTVLQAEEARLKLQDTSDALILFENSRMGELILPKEGIQKAFSQADQLIGHSIRAISSIVNQRGLIGMNIADVMAALNNRDARCLFGYGEARGQNRVQDVLKRAMKSPLINEGDLLKNSKNLLVHIAGGENFTLDEVQALMTELSKKVPDTTRIMFGLSSDPKLGDSICLTLLSSLTADEVIPSATKSQDQVSAAPEPVTELAAVASSTSNEAPSAPAVEEVQTAQAAITAPVIEEVIPAPVAFVAPVQVTQPQAPSFVAPPVVDTPAPKVEEPEAVVAAPIVEPAPVVDAPKVEAPKVEAVAPVTHEPVVQEAPKAPETVIETSLSQLVASHQATLQQAAQTAPVPAAEIAPVELPSAPQVAAPAAVAEVTPAVVSTPVEPEGLVKQEAPIVETKAPEVQETRAESPATTSLFKLVEEPAAPAPVAPAPVVEEAPRAVVNPNWLDRYINANQQVQAEAKPAPVAELAPQPVAPQVAAPQPVAPISEMPPVAAPAPVVPAQVSSPQPAPSSLFRVVGAPQPSAPAPQPAPARAEVASTPATPKPETSLEPAPSLASMFSVVTANRGSKDQVLTSPVPAEEKASAPSSPASVEDSAEENLDVPTWLRMRQKNKN